MSRYVEHRYTHRKSFGNAFGMSFGCLSGIAFFFVLCIAGAILACGGCFTAIKKSQDYLEDAKHDHAERERKRKEVEDKKRPPLEVAPMPHLANK